MIKQDLLRNAIMAMLLSVLMGCPFATTSFHAPPQNNYYYSDTSRSSTPTFQQSMDKWKGQTDSYMNDVTKSKTPSAYEMHMLKLKP